MARRGPRAFLARMADPLPWPRLDPIPPGWLDDTPPEAVARWRAMTPARRFDAFLRTRATVRQWMLAGERLRHPGLDEPALAARVRARLRDGRA